MPARAALLVTTGFLPLRFRDEMHLRDATRQRRFDRLTAALRAANRVAPRPVREFPFTLQLRDLDWRIMTSRRLV